MPWQKIESKEMYKSRWMRVTEDRVKIPGGREIKYSVVHVEPMVVIIPWDGTHLTLVGQYRYPVGEYSWELPAGRVMGKSIEETARAELKEETGFTAGYLAEVGQFNAINGYSTQRAYVFLAKDLKPGKPKREPSEAEMKTKKVTPAEFNDMIRRGEITDGPIIAVAGYILLKNLLA